MGAVKVVILSTMLADAGIGEWGFAALVEADGHRVLFDTGARPDTVLRNARELKVDLSRVTDVVLSHNHGDHTGGDQGTAASTSSRRTTLRSRLGLDRAHAVVGAVAR